MRLIPIILALGLVSCSSEQKAEPIVKSEERNVSREQLECRKLFGPTAKPVLLSSMEYQCQVEVGDPSDKLSALSLTWKAERAKAQKSNASASILKKIDSGWESAAKEYIKTRCPKGFDASPIPVPGKIYCVSKVLRRGLINVPVAE